MTQVTRSDIEAKARQIEMAVTQTRDNVKSRGRAIIIALVALVALGIIISRSRRSGRAVVEVYRV
jgi:hypothetical protein